MIEIYRKSWSCFRQGFWLYVFIAVMLEVLPLLVSGKTATPTLIGLTIFAYFLHRHFLFSEAIGAVKTNATSDAPPTKMGWFVLVTLATVFGPILFAGVIMLKFLPPEYHNGSNLSGTLMLIMMPLYLVSLGFFGTALPASVARRPEYRIAKGFRLSFGIMGRLIVGPALFSVLTFALVVGCSWGLQKITGPNAPWTEHGFGITFRLIGLFNTTLAVAILCQAYRKIVPEAQLNDLSPQL